MTNVEGKATKRISVKRADFITAWEGSHSAKEVAEKTGLEVNSCLARASKMRGEGFALKNMPKGGGVKLNPEEAYTLLASLNGKTIDEVKAEGEKLAEAARKRAAEKAAAKATS